MTLEWQERFAFSQDYYKALEDADEKVQLANQIYDLVSGNVSSALHLIHHLGADTHWINYGASEEVNFHVWRLNFFIPTFLIIIKENHWHADILLLIKRSCHG